MGTKQSRDKDSEDTETVKYADKVNNKTYGKVF